MILGVVRGGERRTKLILITVDVLYEDWYPWTIDKCRAVGSKKLTLGYNDFHTSQHINPCRGPTT